METSAANLDTVEKTGEDFVIHLAGAFLEMTVKEKRYGIQTKNVRKDQRVGAVAGGRQRSLKGPKYNYEVLRLNQGFHSLTEVKNNAGGWVFNISEEQRVRRFLILGSTSPTWYSPAQKLTVQNLDVLISIINNGKAAMILKEIYEISLAGRNPKQEPTMMALALCARYRVHDMTHFGNKQSPDVQRYMAYLQSMHKAAMRIVNDVCRIPTHLFMFIKYCEDVSKWTNANFDQKSSGWGRMMRASISNWYGSKSVDQLALHLTKYRSRDGWSHRDLFRLAHPKSEKHAQVEEHRLEVEQLYHYAAKGTLNTRKLKLKDEEFKLEEPGSKYSMTQMENELKSSALDMVQVFTYINQWTPEQDIVFAIHRYKLVREHIPTEHLNNPDIWRALLCEMPFTALVRNLGKIAAVKALDKVYVELIVNQLTNEQQIKKSRIHPLQILLAKLIYKSGSGEKGSNSWIPDPRVDQALEDAFYLSFVNALPTGKRICFAYDISGSMSARIAGTHLSCRTASAALSLISLKNEENTHCVGFSHELIKLPYDGTWNIAKIEKHMAKLPFGKTDCALPMIYAKRRSLKIDVFVVYTDNETFYGAVHPFKALQDYRKTSGIHDAKLIVMGMTATNFSIADPSDPGMLDIIGLDSSVPQLIHEFVIGRL